MPRPRTNPLPEGVYERRGRAVRYWISVTVEGRRVQRAGANTIPEAVEARRRLLEEMTGASSTPTTLAAYVPRWLAARNAKERNVATQRQLLEDHVLPRFGAIPFSEMRPKHVAAWLRELGAAGVGPKVVRNAHAVLCSVLADARLEELILENVARGLPRGTLPEYRPARKGAFTLDELERLITHPDVPEAYRITFAVSGLTGARLGEVAGLRWRDLDTVAAPLWRWDLRTQYDGETLKTGRPRDVPIHSALRALLAAWKLEGYARAHGAAPRDGDLVCPRLGRHGGAGMHSKRSLASALARWAPRAGVELATRDYHSLRRAFITAARTGGAKKEVLERVTHNAAGEQIDTYTYFGWEALCEQVSCVRIDLRRGELVELDPRRATRAAPGRQA